ncbi:MAG: hypothetical protein CHACPFDD_01865 [Phycisphaerae bacterium]|nr:hypothetical protein [Phycisphaerae bacterium]
MTPHASPLTIRSTPHCCGSGCQSARFRPEMTRRGFIGSAALGGVALAGLSWPSLAAAWNQESLPPPPPRRPLKVKAILTYETPQRRAQTSWRSWGGIQSAADAAQEVTRIQAELEALKCGADFPLAIGNVSAIRGAAEVQSLADLASADAILVYAAGGWMDTFDALASLGKPLIVFCRHKSGPVYLWYEIISPRYLRQHTDSLALKALDEDDVVVDNQEELLWRLRALCGLVNSVGTRIVAVGGPSAWAQPPEVVPHLVEQKWKFDIRTVDYAELGQLIRDARQDTAAVARASARAADYLRTPHSTLETQRSFVDNAFLLEEILRRLMAQADCRAITINECMGTIMPLAETSACLTLSVLNDAGFLAFCESDFVVIPAGVLLANISGCPVFLNDPTYPHDGLITLAHCTGPRRMNGHTLEPARILSHFESDYGAAPKVEMRRGQVVTNIIPDFAAQRWLGLSAKIVDVPSLDICRSQIDVEFQCDSRLLASRMPGFHWITAYGDYRRELGYALKRIPIAWEVLS